jgi:hypothetical protein
MEPLAGNPEVAPGATKRDSREGRASEGAVVNDQ